MISYKRGLLCSTVLIASISSKWTSYAQNDSSRRNQPSKNSHNLRSTSRHLLNNEVPIVSSDIPRGLEEDLAATTHPAHDGHVEGDEYTDILDKKPWGAVILASLLVNMASLAGVVVVVCGAVTKRWYHRDVNKSDRFDWKFTSNMIPSFACGALISTAAFLITPESIEMIGRYLIETRAEAEAASDHVDGGFQDHEDDQIDSQIAWRYGICFVSGFVLPVVSALIFPHYHEPELCQNCESELTANATKAETKGLSPGEPTEEVSSKEAVEQTLEGGGRHSNHSSGGGCGGDSMKHSHHHHSHQAPEPELSSTMKLASACSTDGSEFCTENHIHDDEDKCQDSDASSDGHVEEQVKSKVKKPINWNLASAILIGDFFHNFTDGILLGTAFSLCHKELALAISVATVYHELAQEIADFFLLTKHCNLTIPLALTLNFVGGLSVMLGAILILLFNISSNVTGCILAMGAGVYVNIAGVECLPRATATQHKPIDKYLSLLSIVVGVVPIGLVLLNHGHCEEGH